MPEPSEAVVRGAWDAYRAGDMSALLALVHPAWNGRTSTPRSPDPEPRTCHVAGSWRRPSSAARSGP